jgi:hypothetical protein
VTLRSLSEVGNFDIVVRNFCERSRRLFDLISVAIATMANIDEVAAKDCGE